MNRPPGLASGAGTERTWPQLPPGEDLLLDLGQSVGGTDSDICELVSEPSTRPQCLDRSPTSCQRVDQQVPELFSVRILRDRALELADHDRMVPERQFGSQTEFHRDESQLVEPVRLQTKPLFVCELPERLPTPQREALAAGSEAVLGTILRLDGLTDKPFEHQRIDVLRLRDQLVGVVDADHRLGAEDMPEMRDVRLDCVVRRRWRIVTPHHEDEMVDRDGVLGPDGERPQQCAGVRSADRHRTGGREDVDRSEVAGSCGRVASCSPSTSSVLHAGFMSSARGPRASVPLPYGAPPGGRGQWNQEK